MERISLKGLFIFKHCYERKAERPWTDSSDTVTDASVTENTLQHSEEPLCLLK